MQRSVTKREVPVLLYTSAMRASVWQISNPCSLVNTTTACIHTGRAHYTPLLKEQTVLAPFTAVRYIIFAEVKKNIDMYLYLYLYWLID